jgi:NAD-dependent deacetylase
LIHYLGSINYAITEVASPEGFAKNPQLVLDFYNSRRKQLDEVVLI